MSQVKLLALDDDVEIVYFVIIIMLLTCYCYYVIITLFSVMIIARHDVVKLVLIIDQSYVCDVWWWLGTISCMCLWNVIVDVFVLLLSWT